MKLQLKWISIAVGKYALIINNLLILTEILIRKLGREGVQKGTMPVPRIILERQTKKKKKTSVADDARSHDFNRDESRVSQVNEKRRSDFLPGMRRGNDQCLNHA